MKLHVFLYSLYCVTDVAQMLQGWCSSDRSAGGEPLERHICEQELLENQKSTHQNRLMLWAKGPANYSTKAEQDRAGEEGEKAVHERGR